MAERPIFKYQPNYYRINEPTDEKRACECCGKEVDLYQSHIYSATSRPDCICLECVASGAAAEKFNGTFNGVRPEEFARDPREIVSDPARTDELTRRTPSFFSWQEYDWPVCCDDYCAFLGHYDDEPVQELELDLEDFNPCPGDELTEDGLDYVDETGDGLVFQCLHCKKYYLIVDYD